MIKFSLLDRKIESISSIRFNAKFRHNSANNALKGEVKPFIKPFKVDDMFKQNKLTRLAGNSAYKVNVDVSKGRTSSKPKLINPRDTQVMKGMSRFTKAGVKSGSKIAATFIANIIKNKLKINKLNLTNSTSRGYDTIKESFTDFNNKLKLSNTTNRVLITPKNSTRHHNLRTTQSVTESNLSFQLHANAIGHNSYA